MASRSAPILQLPKILLVLFVLILFLGISVFLVSQNTENRSKAAGTVPSTTFSLMPASRSFISGNTFTETVVVDTAGNSINSVNFTLSYNPTYFEATAFTLISGNALFNSPGSVSLDNTTGTARLLASSGPIGVSGIANVAQITFRVKQPYPTPQYIRFTPVASYAKAPGSDLNMLIGASSATIYSAPTPTPTPSACNSGSVKSFSVSNPCLPNVFNNATYTCTNGTTYTEGNTCQSIEIWAATAKTKCQAQISCTSPTPTRLITPTYTITPTRSPTPTPAMFTFTGPNVSSLPRATSVSFPFVVTEPDGTPGTPTEGFNVQVYVSNATASVVGLNAKFDGKNWIAAFLVPSTTGTYTFSASASCSVDTGLCAQRYGKGRQVNWSKQVTISSYVPTPPPPSPPPPTPPPATPQP